MRSLRVGGATLALVLAFVAVPAHAQVHLGIVGGTTDAAVRSSFAGGRLGVRVAWLEVNAEIGRLQDVLPDGLLAVLNDLQRDLPATATVSLPATYVLGEARFISPRGVLQPFVAAGAGIARLDPRVEVAIGGLPAVDILQFADLRSQQKGLATIGGGVRVDLGPGMVDLAYRYLAVFWDPRPTVDVARARILSWAHVVYLAAGITF